MQEGSVQPGQEQSLECMHLKTALSGRLGNERDSGMQHFELATSARTALHILLWVSRPFNRIFTASWFAVPPMHASKSRRILVPVAIRL